MKNERKPLFSVRQETNQGIIELQFEQENDCPDSLDAQLKRNEERLYYLNGKLKRLTNQAEFLDYGVAAGSGLLCGLLDGLYLNGISLSDAKSWGSEEVEKRIIAAAKKRNEGVDGLADAVHELEKVKNPADLKNSSFGGGQHHFFDFSHHNSPVGLFCSILTQFTGKVYGIDPETGAFKTETIPGFESGLEGNTFGRILRAITQWHLHLLSDMAGTSDTVLKGNYGSGIPGPILSLLSEISSWKGFRDKDGVNQFEQRLFDLYSGKILKDENGESYAFDFRMELGLGHELKQMALPVVLNECLIRFYWFIRKLFALIRKNRIKGIKDLKRLLPLLPAALEKDRTLDRMLTVSCACLTATDVFCAAIRSHGNGNAFLLKINYIGIARFAVVVSKDVIDGIKKSKTEKERMAAINERTRLLNAKVFVLQEDNWMLLQSGEEEIARTDELVDRASSVLGNVREENKTDLSSIADGISEKCDPDFANKIREIMGD